MHIDTDYIKLDSFLKVVALVPSGGEAKQLILQGLVTVNGLVETRRGRKLRPGDRVTCLGETHEVTGGVP